MEAGAEGSEEGQTGTLDEELTESDLHRNTDPAPDTPHDTDPSPTDRNDGGEPGSSAHRAVVALPYLLVGLAALWATRSYWTPGSYVIGFDTYAYSGPNLEVTERAVRDLRIPQINDLIFGGVPHLGNPQAGVLYPPRLLTLFLETNRAMGVLVALHVVLLGLGTVLLMRRLGIGRVGATVAGTALVGSGAVLVKTTQFEQIIVIAWAPLLLACIHWIVEAEQPWRPMAAMAAVTAAVLLAGHPQLVFETIFLAVAAAIGFSIGNRRWHRLPHVAGGAVLGAAIALPQLVAALVATSDSAIDVGREFERLRDPTLSLRPGDMLKALVGTPQDIEPGLFSGGFESVGFLGITAMLLTLIGLVRAVRDRATRPWAISFATAGVVALVWSLGPRTFLFRFAFWVIPGFDLARGSARWMIVVAIVATLFAGIGAQAVVDRARGGDVVVAAVAVIVAAGLIAVGLVDAFGGRTVLIWAVLAMIAIGLVAISATGTRRGTRLAGAAIVALLAIELVAMGRNSIPERLRSDTPFTEATSVPTEWLAGRTGYTIALTDDGRGHEYQVPGLRPNTNVYPPVASIDGYDGGVQVTGRWTAALLRFREDPITDLPMRNAVQVPVDIDRMARLGVRYLLLDWTRPADAFVPDWDGPVARDDVFGVFENPAWLGEAVAWPAAEEAATDSDAAQRLRDAPERYEATALVDDPDAAFECEGAETECTPVGLPVERRSPEHVVVRTSLDRPTIVAVHRQALPDWSVHVDGEPADEIVVDGLFLGVAVPAGDHVIEWRYRSPLLGPTLVMSALALLATAGLLAASIIPRWRARRGG